VDEADSDFVSSSRVDHCGPQRLKPGLRKCECVLSLIPENTAAHVPLDLKLFLTEEQR